MSAFLLVSLCVSAVYGFMAWMLGRSPANPPAWLKLLLPVVLIAHGALIYQTVLGQGAIQLGFGTSLSTILWLTALIYWVSSRRYPLVRIQAWVSALAAVGVLAPLLFSATHAIPDSEALALRAHLIVSLLAYGFLAIAVLHAMLMATLEKRLHRGTALTGGAPPLLTMEAVLFRTIAVGFVLLTLAVSSGILFSEELFGKPLQFTHKIVFALLSWATFGGLLLGRRLRGWRGRTAVFWTLTGFVFLLLSYVGTQFVLEVLLHRQG